MARKKATAQTSFDSEQSGCGPREPVKQHVVHMDCSDADDKMPEQMRFVWNSLQDIFKKELAFPASSSFICAYPEAPNPCLNVRGIGTIGLPLHARDAEAIKTRASQAPFGKATETMVDKSVRHYAPETS